MIELIVMQTCAHEFDNHDLFLIVFVKIVFEVDIFEVVVKELNCMVGQVGLKQGFICSGFLHLFNVLVAFLLNVDQFALPDLNILLFLRSLKRAFL